MATTRLGRYEVERDALPDLCMRCGAPATIHKNRNFSWYPPWIAVTILAGLLVFFILAMVLTKRMKVSVPLCDKHRNHWLSRSLLVGLSFLLILGMVVGAIVLSANVQNDTVSLIAWLTVAVAFVSWLIVAVIAQGTAIKPIEITDRSITLKGVAKEFADAVLEERDRRVEAEEDYDDRPAQRRRRIESDQYYDRDEPRGRQPRRSREEDY
jgi:small-conductance mechanosensitive channel